MRAAVVAAGAVLLLLGIATPVAVATASAAGVPAGNAVPTDDQTADVVVVVPGSTATTPSGTGGSGSGSGAGSGSGSHGGSSGASTAGPTDGASSVPSEPVATKIRLSISPWRIHAGGTVRVEGAGFTPGEKVRLVLYPGAVVSGEPVADARGAFVGTVATTKKTAPGLYTVQATGELSHRIASGGFAIAAPLVAGSAWWGWALAGGGVCVGAFVVVLTARFGMLAFAAIGGAR